MLKIDGSVGENGGQILRPSISLAVLLQKPIEIYNIRTNRLNPGLLPRHIQAIKTLTHLFNAKVENLHIGSRWLRLIPNLESLQIQNDKIEIDIGSNGSIPMILQKIIPTIALSGNYLEIKITGRTDVRMSPTIDYMQYLVSDVYKMIGIEFSIKVLRRGYHPLGGGIVQIEIFPCNSLGLFDLLKFKIVEPKIVGVCSRLPRNILDRQISSALLVLEKNGLSCNNCIASVENSLSPSSSISAYSKSDFGPYIDGDSV